MKKFVLLAVMSLVSGVIGLLLVEGTVILARWKYADHSLVYNIYSSIQAQLIGGERGVSESGLAIASRNDIEALIPDMVAEGVGMGNVPYEELRTGRAALNDRGPDGCYSPRANVRKTMTYIRSADYELFDPPSLFYDTDAKLNERLWRFIDTYAVHKALFTSNAMGERITVPEVDAPTKVLVAGDSVAAGAMIGDSETIESQLQRDDKSVRYVNLGVNGATANDIVCKLRKAAQRYKGSIGGLIYVYCENDFDASRPFGSPEEVINWLREYAKNENIPWVTIVFAPYIYNIVPNLTRFVGTRGGRHGVFTDQARRLKAQAEAAGFRYLSIGDVALAEARRRGTDFAVFSLFVDHVHLSRYGVSLLVGALRNAG